MSVSVGFDTSNYTTSLSVCENGEVVENRKLPVPVEKGKRGIRQSDAVFHHTVNLAKLTDGLDRYSFDCVGVSDRPRDVSGSYMPCFLSGFAGAKTVSGILGIPLYTYSHQQGHVMAALYSAGREELYKKQVIAFHLSGGTTEMLLCENGRIQKIGGTLDISAGQLIDRVGVKLGMSFPCGAQIEAAAHDPSAVPVKLKNTGMICNLSGFENQADALIAQRADTADICDFVIACVRGAVENMLKAALQKYGTLPIVFAGGVSANTFLKKHFSTAFNALFPDPAYATDNAAGIAILAQKEFYGRKFS